MLINNSLRKIDLSFIPFFSDEKARSKSEFKEKLELAHRDILSEEAGFNYLPGITNLIFAPAAAYNLSQKAKTSFRVGDAEGVANHSLRTHQSVVAFGGAACSAVTYGKLLSDKSEQVTVFETIGCYGAILGLILCAMELVAEVYGLFRQFHFYYSPLMQFSRFLERSKNTIDKDPHDFIKKLEVQFSALNEVQLPEVEKKQINDMLKRALRTDKKWEVDFYSKKLRFLSAAILAKSFSAKYFDGVNVGKVISLERRVGIWACNKLDQKLLSLAKRAHDGVFQGAKKAEEEILRNFKILNEQTLKKMVIHSVGTVAVIFTAITSIIVFGVTLGTGALASIFLGSFGFTLARFLIVNGVFSHEGWAFDYRACLPEAVLNKIDQISKKSLTISTAKS